MKPQTKAKKILQHLFSGKTLTQLESFRLYADFSLPQNVKKFRKRGWNIQTLAIPGKFYVKYWMPKSRLNEAMAKHEGLK